MSDSSTENECIRRVLVAMVIADGDIDPDELMTAQRVFRDITGVGISDVELRKEAEQMQSSRAKVAECLGAAGGLDLDARKRIFGAAFAVASADGFVLEEEDALLANVAAALGFSEAQYRGLVEEQMNAD